MKIDILTLFPKMFKGPFEESIVKRAREKEIVKIKIHNLRDWAKDKHKTVDDKPYGGGAGMVLMIEPIFNALKNLKTKNSKIILLSPQGKKFSQEKAKYLSKQKHLILICGHYEGFDQRIRENLIDEEISIGDYVLTGGELPAMVLTDSIVRLLPGALGDKESLINETHSNLNLKKHPVYTRPENFKGLKVPEILVSGDHKKIKAWKKEKISE